MDNNNNNVTPDAYLEKANKKKSSLNKVNNKVTFAQYKESESENDDDDNSKDRFF